MLSIKDEYEVARLMTQPRFLAQIEREFEGGYRMAFNFAPPAWARRDPDTGRLRKREYSTRWMLPALRLLARLRPVRNTWLDPFRYSGERREQRALLAAFERELGALVDRLDASNYTAALSYATLVDGIRGYGHVRSANLERVRGQQHAILDSIGIVG
jgi:indolepyruvate ferredoxin oxidoreductase